MSATDPVPSAYPFRVASVIGRSRSIGEDLSIDLVDWAPLPWSSGCASFRAMDAKSATPYEVRLLSRSYDSTSRARLQEQLRQTELVAGLSARRLVEARWDEDPPKLIIEPAEPLKHFVRDATSKQRLEIAARIVQLVERSLMGGLRHGSVSAETVVRTSDGDIKIDYFSSFLSPDPFQRAPTAASDASATVLLLREILEPILSDESVEGTVVGQRRGQIRNLMASLPDDDNCFALLDRWSELLSAITGSDEERPAFTNGASQSLSPGRTTDDSTCEIAINTEIPDSDAADDRTGEISVTPRMADLSAAPLPGVGDSIGRYKLESLLGEGGMGVVYRGVDQTSGMTVAVKLLRPIAGDFGRAIRRFQKEARLLADQSNSYVTRLYESGCDQGIHFLALEYVDGSDLKYWMKMLGPMDEELALRLTADIARALVEAHQAEIVHRDIKPENVLLQGDLENRSDDGNYQLKLTDFGIARAVRQSASMDVTRAGSLLGTPEYMSPEQFKGTDKVSPATDIYSIGITLYAMLVGDPPFRSDDPMNLAAMHCFDVPPDVRKRGAAVSESTASLLGRMLAKAPADRPADASELVEEIERLLRGEPNEFEQHPKLPVVLGPNVWERSFQWDLDSSPHELWPHVSNTERLNRAIGLHSVDYRTQRDRDHGLRRFGSFRLAGLRIEWEEHPFEWIEGQRMGVLREFQSGPFCWFASMVELSRRPEGGTRLTHTLKIAPRNPLGRLIASFEAGRKSGRALEKVYRRIDHSLRHQRDDAHFDPFEPSAPVPDAVLKRIDERMELMITKGVSIDVASKLVEYIRDAPAQELAQIRPLALADRLGLTAEEIIDACLVAADSGLLLLRWDVLCPTCRAPASAAGFLSEIDRHTNCEACDADFRSDLASAIELVFRTHAEIRKPDEGQYCIGGPEHSPHVVSQLRLQPRERLEIRVPLTVGDYLLRGSRVGSRQNVQVRSRSGSSSVDIWLGRSGPDKHVPLVRSGRPTFVINNDQDCHEIVRIERTIPRSDVVTAAVATSMPRFRELFPDQILHRDGTITADELTFVSARISTSEILYESVGDAEAYAIIRQTLSLIENCVRTHTGAMIKSIGETILASFQDPSSALAAALSIEPMIREHRELDEVLVASGIHRGKILVTTQNGRLDYFGTTARQVIALSERFPTGIALTDSVFADPAVRSFVASCDASVEHRTVDLPGSKNRLVQHLATNR